MASTYTDALSLDKQGTGDNNNTWGTALNAVLDNIDDAVAARLSKSVAGSSDVTLTSAEALNAWHEYNGALTGNINVIVPTSDKVYFIFNNTSGAYTLTVKTAAGSGIAVTQGKKTMLYCDGTNVIAGLDYIADSLSNIVEDTTPQLGGDLDCNGAQIQWSQGADVASATALAVLTDGNYFDVTGTTTITSINTTGGAGTQIKLHFDGALTLTHHATNLILPGGVNITTAAGDEAEFIEYGAGTYRCTNYVRASGKAVDVDTLYADTADVLTVGFAATDYNAGTKSSGTFTPDEANGNMQYAVNGGAHTLAPPTNSCTIIIQYTNNASAGTITTSGFTLVDGDTISTTDGDDFFFFITKSNGFSHLHVKALQ